MLEEKVCGTKAFGIGNLEFHNEAQERFAGLGLLDQRRVLAGKKLAIDAEQRVGFTAVLPFYLFKCENEDCGRIAKSYPNGFIERQYLLCSACGMHHDFVPWWVPWAQLFNTIRFAIKFRGMRE